MIIVYWIIIFSEKFKQIGFINHDEKAVHAVILKVGQVRSLSN